MLHVDIPSQDDIEWLAGIRESACLSLYLPTTPVTPDTEHDKIVLRNLVRDGMRELGEHGVERDVAAAMQEALDDLLDDNGFWAYQANSLAVFATAEHIFTFRLPNALEPTVQTGDRLFIKPLLRSVTLPQSAFVLALAQGSVRLVEVSADMPAFTVAVDDLPGAARIVPAKDRSLSGRLQGPEGQKVRMTQYARQVDRALRQVIAGREVPLILAATEPLNSIYRTVNTYPHLAEEGIGGNPEARSDADLAADARGILDRLYRQDLERLKAQFDGLQTRGRATTDVLAAARAATNGAIATLFVDIDAVLPGVVGDDGTVRIDAEGSSATYGVADEIARRALLSGARVLAVRRPEMPGGGAVAAILRYPI